MKSQQHHEQLDCRQRETVAIGRQQGLSISRELVPNRSGPHYSCQHAQHRRDRRRRQAHPA